ncbi:adhesion G-protein coupled receptor G1 [Thalassophryne amazonica]|uniref:adhesion G-protein coupled receptor G1 n=1 Tax=Thalassophryne amazonica TaxID=390379 RepID=UPI001471E941|nr:adhesion G-protein coupled receptor G1 [Thalassophryne amazonica]
MIRIIVFLKITVCYSATPTGSHWSYPRSNTHVVPTTKAASHDNNCKNVIQDCLNEVPWTQCFEKRSVSCIVRGRQHPGFIRRMMSTSEEAEESPTDHHRVHVPSSALRRSKGGDTKSQEEYVIPLVIAVFNSSLFKLSRRQGRARGRGLTPDQSEHNQVIILGNTVLAVKLGSGPVHNLSEPIKLIFKHNNQVQNGTCVFWLESNMKDGTGHWRADGCHTTYEQNKITCSCNHLSFFAVLVNPITSVDSTNAVSLSYITYVGSVLSVIFAIISLVIYICLQQWRPEKAIGLHMQLTVALLCLHLSFLLCSFWVWLQKEDSLVCQILGLFLHWSLLATFCWMALEGFHLYLLLVRVFNIYVRRYLLKLSLVGWGFPTVIAVVCGTLGVYGKYSLVHKDGNNHTTTSQICWISSNFPQRNIVSYITIVGFLCLVILYNSCMLGLVIFKLRMLRRASGDKYGSGGWKKMYREKGTQLWKDCATVLGLSFVLGIPWALAFSTFSYFSLFWIYLFTILNSLQGVIVFLWSLALTCKIRSDSNSSAKSSQDPSTLKMTDTNFSNGQ